MTSDLRAPARAPSPRAERSAIEATRSLAPNGERSPAVAARIAALAAELAAGDLDRIHGFGREIGLQASRHADELLA